VFYPLTPGNQYWWQELDYDCLGAHVLFGPISESQSPVATLSYTNPSPSSISLTWNNAATYGGLIDFVSYQVMESVNGGSYNSVAAITSESTMVDNITGLASGTNYGFYIVTTDDCGTCSPVPSFTSDSNVITYGSPIALTASVTATPSVIDDGQATTLACAAAGGSSPYAYSWNFGDGTPGASGQTVSHTYNTAGTMSPTCTVTDNSGTKASGATPVTVNQPITVTVTASHSYVSPGTAITFSLTVSGGSNSYTNYTWVFGDGTNGYGTSLVHTYASAGVYNATAYVKDSLSGMGTGSVTIFVVNLAVTATDSASYGVPGTTLYFNASASGGGGSPYSYSWSFGDSTTGTGASTTHVYSSPGSYTPSVTVTDSLGGTASTTLVAIDIEQPLQASMSLSNQVPVPGDVVTLTGAGAGGSGSYTCSWNFGDSQTGSGCMTTHSWAGNGSYTIALTLTDSQGHSAMATTTLVVEPPLVASIQVTPSSPTVGEQSTLATKPTGGDGTYSCSWDFGDQTTGSGCTATHSWSAAGVYDAEVTVSDTSGRKTNAWLNVTVIAPLSVTIQLSATSANVGQSVTLTASVSGGSGGNACHWDFGDSNSGNGCTLAHAWVTSGKYMVTLAVNDSAGHHTTAYANVTITVSPSGSLGLSGPGSSSLVGVVLIVAAVVLALVAMMLFLRYRPGKGSRGGTSKESESVSKKTEDRVTAQSAAPVKSVSEEWKET
jgi:PKD repeat protein